jgi:hypothetical protein
MSAVFYVCSSLIINIEYTATSYITTLINRKIKRAENNKLPGATISECLDQQSLIAEYLMPDLDDAPCVLVHGDLTAENVIVDEDFNVKAYVPLFPPNILLQLTQPLQYHRPRIRRDHPIAILSMFPKLPDARLRIIIRTCRSRTWKWYRWTVGLAV